VGYYVQFADAVLDYLEHRVEGLTDADRVAIVAGATEELARDADRFLARHPCSHEALSFWYDYPHLTAHALFDFKFVVGAWNRAMGVVQVVYVEYTMEPHG
jgi:hypothetical protein